VHNAWSVVEFVVLLVLGIAAVQALIWIPIIIWWRRRARDAKARLAAAIEAEGTIRAAEKGIYRGATAAGYPVVNNNGTIALTDRRLIFVTVTGKVIEIPRDEITGVREAKVFKSSVRGGRSHLIVQVPTGEVAFYVGSNADWINAIMALRAK
jgi:type II secretory pathway pseudopilin PulG